VNKIPLPIIDDHAALQELADNQLIASYPHLKGAVAGILEGYAQYEAAAGNAFTVVQVDITPEVDAYLKAHYKSPPNALKHITGMREEREHGTCPMCGSFHRGTLDHLLPQISHGAFAVFSRNLVPACKCNSKRRDILTGPSADERVLHPYFDECLSERLVAACFADLGAVPKVGLRLCVDVTHPDYAAIDFHFRSIVKRTAITRYLRDRWADLCRKPSLVVRELKRNPPTPGALRQILEDELDQLDDVHQSKNNWNSIFAAGLLAPDVKDWLFQQIHAHGRLPNAPLT
jgi:hypothetical protein